MDQPDKEPAVETGAPKSFASREDVARRSRKTKSKKTPVATKIPRKRGGPLGEKRDAGEKKRRRRGKGKGKKTKRLKVQEEIKRLQEEYHGHLIPKAHMRRMISGVMDTMAGFEDYKFAKDARAVLQEASEVYVVQIFDRCSYLLDKLNRKELKPIHFDMVLNLSRLAPFKNR